MVMAVKVAGQKPRPVTTVSDKAKALERVRALFVGCEAATCPSEQFAAGPVAPPPLNLRERTSTVNYDDTVRNASCPAGPGRGRKRQADEDALKTAQAVLKKSKPTNDELRDALGKLTEQQQLLQRWYGKVVSDRNRAFALLREEYTSTACCKNDKTVEEAEAARASKRRAVITDLVGEGYDLSGSQRTLSRHKSLIIGAVKRLAGAENTVGQQQLAEVVLCHYKSDGGAVVEKCSEEYVAPAAVIEGLVETLETLRKRNNGRFPTKDRITQDVIRNSVVSKAKKACLSAIAKLLKMRTRTVYQAAARMEGSAGESERSYFEQQEKKCNQYPVEWTEFVENSWDELTRASECTKDEAKDPVADSSGAHRTKIQDGKLATTANISLVAW